MVNELVEAIVRVMDNSEKLAYATIIDKISGKKYKIICSLDGSIEIEISKI